MILLSILLVLLPVAVVFWPGGGSPVLVDEHQADSSYLTGS